MLTLDGSMTGSVRWCIADINRNHQIKISNFLRRWGLLPAPFFHTYTKWGNLLIANTESKSVEHKSAKRSGKFWEKPPGEFRKIRFFVPDWWGMHANWLQFRWATTVENDDDDEKALFLRSHASGRRQLRNHEELEFEERGVDIVPTDQCHGVNNNILFWRRVTSSSKSPVWSQPQSLDFSILQWARFVTVHEQKGLSPWR